MGETKFLATSTGQVGGLTSGTRTYVLCKQQGRLDLFASMHDGQYSARLLVMIVSRDDDCETGSEDVYNVFAAGAANNCKLHTR